MIGASQSALSIQNPSQSGPRTQGDGACVALLPTIAGQTTVAERPLIYSKQFCSGDSRTSRVSYCLPFELQVNAAPSRVDSNALLRGGNADYHTGLI